MTLPRATGALSEGEVRNLWDDPAHKGLRDDLRIALLDSCADHVHRLPASAEDGQLLDFDGAGSRLLLTG